MHYVMAAIACVLLIVHRFANVAVVTV